MVTKFSLFPLVLCVVCYGQEVHNDLHKESTPENISKTLDTTQMINSSLIPVLQNSDYDNDNAPRGVVVGVPIVSILLIACCVYFCCRCRTQKNQGVVMTVHPPAPMPGPQIIIQQNSQQPAGLQTAMPPPYPPQQHAPPPYDTQPVWGQQPPQQQFHQQQPPPPQQQYNQPQQQIPTSYTNPNYAQPPVNMQYGQEKY